MRVAYQGVEGAYSAIAARRHFGPEAVLAGFATFADAFACAERGDAEFAVIPVENSTTGEISETRALLAATDLERVGEHVLEVEHCLLGLPGARLEGVRRVASHPQALAQCRRFLAASGAVAEPYEDTAGAARLVKVSGLHTLAAIASEEAGMLYGLVVLARGIADAPDNRTRFLVLARKAPAP